MINKIYFYKSYNINKKIIGCFNCHKINKIKNFLPNINNLSIKYIYNKLKNFKELKTYNYNMNFIVYNLKNKYILEISKYLFFLKNLNKLIFINLI